MIVHQVVPVETHDINRTTNKRAVSKNKAKKMNSKHRTYGNPFQKRPFIISASRTCDDTVFTYEDTVHSETIGILNVSH